MSKKIILVADDIRASTGVATMSKSILMNTKDHIDWVQLAGLRNHPKDKTINEYEGIKIYGANNYGDEKYLHEIIEREDPDGIMFFTDPRHFYNHFFCEYDIRQDIPYMYYTIWDNYPVPQYNEPFYNSCDGLFCISKVTHDVVGSLVGDRNKIINYVPHGIDEYRFKPKDRRDKKFQSKVREIVGFDPFEYQFIIFWSNKNMERKRPKDLLMAFDKFIDDNDLFEYDALLVMNTNPVSESGTNLYTFIRHNIKHKDNIKFVENGKFKRKDMPYLYNMADIVVNNSDNEGWGLAVTEAKMCGVPVLATNTGGMKDQLLNDDGTHGEWAFVLEPEVENMSGKGDTPYIYKSIISIDQIAKQLSNAFAHTYEELLEKGEKGREHAISKGHTEMKMSEGIVDSIYETLENFEPREKLKLTKF